MHRIAIVEDNPTDAKLLQGYIERFCKEENELCETECFSDGINFLSAQNRDFEVVFMDVEMPYLNGMETSRKLRESDIAMAIIFVTNMAQYAIEGYEVNALDFMVKPVSYFNFASKLKKSFKYFENKREKFLTIHNQGETVRIPISQIYYVEKEKNYLVFHTELGNFSERKNLYSMETDLQRLGFVKCRSGCMVNIKNIRRYSSTSVVVGTEEIPVSRGQSKEFFNKLLYYLGG